MFGNLRDSGFIVLCLKEVFNVLYDREDVDEITVKLSFINYDSNSRVPTHNILSYQRRGENRKRRTVALRLRA